MTTLKSFIQKWDGKYLESWDRNNLNQCTDLVLEWLKTIGRGDIIPLGILNAYEIYNPNHTKLKKYFDFIPNTPNAIPDEGDIVVWKKAYNGGAGHTGVATGRADIMSFDAFVQNDPIGSKSHVKKYKYTNVAGWLRYKLPIDMKDPLTECLAQHQPLVDEIREKDILIAKMKLDFKATEKRLKDEKDKALKKKEFEIEKLNKILAESNKNTLELTKQIKELKKKSNAYQVERDTAVDVSKGLEKSLAVTSNALLDRYTELYGLVYGATYPPDTDILWEDIVNELYERFNGTVQKAQLPWMAGLQQALFDISTKLK